MTVIISVNSGYAQDTGAMWANTKVNETHPKTKHPFKEKHPKLYKLGKKIKRIANDLEPILSCTACVAEIITMCRVL